MQELMRRTGRLAIAAAIAAMAVGCDLDSVLEVSDPSRFTSEDLDAAIALPAVANGVEGDLHLAIDDIAIQTGLLSDELMHTGTWTQYEDDDVGRHRPGVGSSVAQGNLFGVRTAAREAEERFNRVMGDSAGRTKLMAQVTAAAGWANLLVAMVNCEGVAEPLGPAVSDTAMYEAAIPLLQRAVSVAQAASEPLYENFSRAGLARAYLMIGRYDEALAEAQKVPNGFEYAARYSEAGTSNALVTLNHYTENKAAGLDSRRWPQTDTTGAKDIFLDHFSGQEDPRVPLVHRVGTRLGVDGVKKFFSHNKYTNRGADIAMTHWREMRLIEAEVYWQKTQYAQAIAKMNEVRSSVGLPDLDNPNTRDGVLDYLLEERFATLFLEGQRANDLYRFNLFPEVIGTGYNTKFILNTGEIQNNPNIAQVRSCPKVS
jgi:tetratricopeptide (TPR) repeat protein